MAASQPTTPRPLRAAALLAAGQGVAILAAGLVQLGLTIFGDPDNLGRALLAARTPVVVVQLLALPVGWSLAFDAGRGYIGLPLLVLAGVILLLLFTPDSIAALDREPDGR